MTAKKRSAQLWWIIPAWCWVCRELQDPAGRRAKPEVALLECTARGIQTALASMGCLRSLLTASPGRLGTAVPAFPASLSLESTLHVCFLLLQSVLPWFLSVSTLSSRVCFLLFRLLWDKHCCDFPLLLIKQVASLSHPHRDLLWLPLPFGVKQQLPASGLISALAPLSESEGLCPFWFMLQPPFVNEIFPVSPFPCVAVSLKECPVRKCGISPSFSSVLPPAVWRAPSQLSCGQEAVQSWGGTAVLAVVVSLAALLLLSS